MQRLTQTYLTLSLADIASQVGLSGADEAEAHILRYANPTDADPKTSWLLLAGMRSRSPYQLLALFGVNRCAGCRFVAVESAVVGCSGTAVGMSWC